MKLKYNPYPLSVASTYFSTDVECEEDAFSMCLAVLTYQRYIVELGLIQYPATADSLFITESDGELANLDNTVKKAVSMHPFNRLSSALHVGEHSITKEYGARVKVATPGVTTPFCFPVVGGRNASVVLRLLESFRRFLFGVNLRRFNVIVSCVERFDAKRQVWVERFDIDNDRISA